MRNKHANTETSVEWKILDKAKSYKKMSRKCMLCLTEKYHILFSKLNLLNSCSKLVTKYMHENKFYLSTYKDLPLYLTNNRYLFRNYLTDSIKI